MLLFNRFPRFYLFIHQSLSGASSLHFQAFFFVLFFLIENPFTSNEGCVRLIMSKVSRKPCHRIEFLDLRAWMLEPYFVTLTTALPLIFLCTVFMKQWGFPKKHNAYLLLFLWWKCVSVFTPSLRVGLVKAIVLSLCEYAWMFGISDTHTFLQPLRHHCLCWVLSGDVRRLKIFKDKT